MKPLDVYPLFDIEPVRGQGVYIWDKNDTRYLDLYGGHAVISIGHGHTHYISSLSRQLEQIGFYSNSVKIPIQQELAEKLGRLCGYPEYDLFLCNSGAEANENALKLASFKNGRKKLIAFTGAFHGRTSAAVSVTHDPKISAPVNETGNVVFLPFNDEFALEENFSEDVCAVIVEGIQGVAGVHVPSARFLHKLRELCDKTGALLILDEVQSGYGRSGNFFAHQHSGIKADIVTSAKGMGNGFPVAGVLVSPEIKVWPGMLGTTFGGNYLACAAAISVLDVIENEGLLENAARVGKYLIDKIWHMEGVREVRGKGLMIGIEMNEPVSELRNNLLHEYKIFTGAASDKNTLRILPPLCLKQEEADIFLEAFEKVTEKALAV